MKSFMHAFCIYRGVCLNHKLPICLSLYFQSSYADYSILIRRYDLSFFSRRAQTIFICFKFSVVVRNFFIFIRRYNLFFQSSYADYIYSYAEKNVDGLERSEGAVLNSCFWVNLTYSCKFLTIDCTSCRNSSAFFIMSGL